MEKIAFEHELEARLIAKMATSSHLAEAALWKLACQISTDSGMDKEAIFGGLMKLLGGSGTKKIVRKSANDALASATLAKAQQSGMGIKGAKVVGVQGNKPPVANYTGPKLRRTA